MEKETEQKPKLDFSSESGIIAAAQILIRMAGKEGFEGLVVKEVSPSAIILNAPDKQAMKAFKFAINQDWPVESLSLIWRHRDKKVRPAFWKLDFWEQPV